MPEREDSQAREAVIRTVMPRRTSDDEQRFALRDLPSVDQLLRQPAIATLLDEFARRELLTAIREVLDRQRRAMLSGRPGSTDIATIALAVRQSLHARSRPSVRRVINATGVVLHTGLGRAPLPAEAVQAVAETAGGYCNLEIDLASGERGDRFDHARSLLRELTGAEDALVVNNNAAATMLTLTALARDREVIVSRGQLVEIGGSYRMPDIMAASGCRTVEIGTTNRTRIADYAQAITEHTSVLLHVHTSNYRIRGFAESATLQEMVDLARSRRPREIFVVDDLGSGLLFDPAELAQSAGGNPRREPADDHAAAVTSATAPWDEPRVQESVAAGVDLVLFSGDKLLGGPQAGIIVGKSVLVERLRTNALTRALRPDKMTLAALEATLRLYRDPAALPQRLPVARMLLASQAAIEPAARRLEACIRASVPAAAVEIRPDSSFAGGGSLPTLAFSTWVVVVRIAGAACTRIAAALRARDAPVICRIQRDALIFDCRTLMDGDVEQIASALAEAARDEAAE